MNSTVFEDAVEMLVFSVLKNNVSTIKPAVIDEVDYDECHLTATPLTKTKRQDDVQIEFSQVEEVPIVVMSANAGSARVTLPVKAGDDCLILYSDREFSNLLDTDGSTPVDSEEYKPFGQYPIAALCGFFTRPNAKALDSDNIEIHNGTTNITIAPSGAVTINASSATTNCDLQVNGSITASDSITSGSTITSGSDIVATTDITASGSVSGATVSATTSMSVAGTTMTVSGGAFVMDSVEITTATLNGIVFSEHMHSYVVDGVTSSTGTPV
jgi:hypothetical protein